ncbi:threonine ammonia-lyase [Eubacterium pyruvativorans]|uniref:threonine ammonia-lyase n=1 Tax=Eubacterium pyruvativorans TaxID=155865 RepID=UPI000884989C|nr:threonine ammonia-lyase [Eubacterium pyruvativorans]MCI5747513.1 threonine ammonia-lyase [Eubacterium pyruvativorans]MDD6707260.1 threonine ammonia-lyase [Eubacterium pyruvativorans]MDD7684452.1 threonine ammonia-lyase [Eubacterium pyruvativorans]MDY4049669.1 threonine ammonia-lyase [Eubacterium pyruvativorans]SDF50804.1 threonine dehydratase [Eubacterium pyruvativorans]
MFTKENFLDAARVVKDVTIPTDLIYSEFFSKLTGGEIYLKPENLQRTGAYKVRGSYYKISKMSEEDRAKGLVTASAGNHAQGVAYAAKKFGCRAVIVMPVGTPLIKIKRTRALGAEVVLHGDVYDDAYAHAVKLAEEEGLTMVHPFDDYDVATGQGSIAVEILNEQPDTDVILAPIGGGGLSTGVSVCAHLLKHDIEVIGVEPRKAASMTAALEAGHPVELATANTIADGTAVKKVGENVFPYARDNIDKVICVDDEDLVGSFIDMVENHKLVVENSGLLTVASLKQLDLKGKKAVCILSGGNMDVTTMGSMIQNGLIQRGRVFTVSIRVPDKPGQIASMTAIAAEHKANILRIDHNRWVSPNRALAVEVVVTFESFDVDHKREIIKALNEAGFRCNEIGARL